MRAVDSLIVPVYDVFSAIVYSTAMVVIVGEIVYSTAMVVIVGEIV